MEASPHSPLRSTNFLDLPLEVRRQIYHECLVRSEPIVIPYWDTNGTDDCKNLLFVSKMVSHEASEILYGSNVFRLQLNNEGVHYLKTLSSESNRLKIRQIQLVMRPRMRAYSMFPDEAVWSPILKRLTKLSLVPVQPLRDLRHRLRPRVSGSSIQKEIDDFISWIRPVIQYLVSHVPRPNVIEVDHDDNPETDAVFAEYFPQGYRKVQTPAGDFYFRRRKYGLRLESYDD